MTWRGYVLVLMILSILAGGCWIVDQVTTPPAPFQNEALSIVLNPERVRVQRMRPMDGEPPEGAAFYENCSLVGTGRAVDPPEGWLAELQDIVSNGRTYAMSAKSGTPNPKVVVRFVSGDQKIDVMFAFDVDMVVIQCNGKPCGAGSFTARRKELVQLIKELFPEDGEIQSISEV